MDKRKTPGLSHDGRVSQAYLHERSILQKRLDQFQREQDRSIKKILNRQETLANALAAETSKYASMETSLVEMKSLGRSRAGSISNLFSGNPENMEINPRLRKVSVPSDMRYRKLSFASSETKSAKRAVRQISDPLQSSSQISEDSKIIVTAPRRKQLTTGQLDLAALSKDFRPQSGDSESHIVKNTLTRYQKKARENLLNAKLPSELASLHFTPSSNSKADPNCTLEKMNLQTRSSSLSTNTTSRTINDTSAEVKNKYLKDSFIIVSNKFLDNQRKISHESSSSFQEPPDVSNDKVEPQESNVDKIIQTASPGALITNGQFQNTDIDASDVFLCRKSATEGVQTRDRQQKGSNFNLNSGNDDETGSESDKRFFRRVSLSGNKSTRHLHALTSSAQEADATGAVHHRGNAWTEQNRTGRRKISTVVAPKGIVINGNSSVSSNEKTDKEQSPTNETVRSNDALRDFRRLALVAVATERLSKPTSGNRQIAFPERKLSTTERLEELQRPTESYLRRNVVEETVSKTPSLTTRSKSLSGINSSKTSASSVKNIRRVSQAAMTTRILIDRKHRKTSEGGFLSLESQRQKNPGKTLAEMMNELKDCRYLRNSTMDDE